MPVHRQCFYDRPVVEIEYINTELLPDIPALKNTIVDIRCRDEEGRQFLVEIPNTIKNKLHNWGFPVAIKKIKMTTGNATALDGTL